MNHRFPSLQARRAQRGAALIVVLILLILVTLLGLASLRGTLMEERMSANMFDRSVAFQSAESALRVAEQKVREAAAAGKSIGVDCSEIGKICSGNPPNANAKNPAGCAANASGCWISVTDKTVYPEKLAAGAPQYYIEFMGDFPVNAEDAGAGRSASGNQYGAPPPTYGKAIYRISARSHDPGGLDRAVVALQATIELR